MEKEPFLKLLNNIIESQQYFIVAALANYKAVVEMYVHKRNDILR